MTGRSKSAISLAMDQLVTAGVLLPVSTSQRNRAREAQGLLGQLAELESGRRRMGSVVRVGGSGRRCLYDKYLDELRDEGLI